MRSAQVTTNRWLIFAREADTQKKTPATRRFGKFMLYIWMTIGKRSPTT